MGVELKRAYYRQAIANLETAPKGQPVELADSEQRADLYPDLEAA
ncbi:hypothetical protein [Gemmata sp.]